MLYLGILHFLEHISYNKIKKKHLLMLLEFVKIYINDIFFTK